MVLCMKKLLLFILTSVTANIGAMDEKATHESNQTSSRGSAHITTRNGRTITTQAVNSATDQSSSSIDKTKEVNSTNTLATFGQPVYATGFRATALPQLNGIPDDLCNIIFEYADFTPLLFPKPLEAQDDTSVFIHGNGRKIYKVKDNQFIKISGFWEDTPCLIQKEENGTETKIAYFFLDNTITEILSASYIPDRNQFLFTAYHDSDGNIASLWTIDEDNTTTELARIKYSKMESQDLFDKGILVEERERSTQLVNNPIPKLTANQSCLALMLHENLKKGNKSIILTDEQKTVLQTFDKPMQTHLTECFAITEPPSKCVRLLQTIRSKLPSLRVTVGLGVLALGYFLSKQV